jgi:hypothetical protein
MRRQGLSLFARVRLFMRRIFDSLFGGESDPHADVLVPKSHRPSGRTSAAAVMEPDGDIDVTAVGTNRGRPRR